MGAAFGVRGRLAGEARGRRKGPEAGPRRASLLFAPRDVKGADRFLEPRQVLVFRLAAAECFVDV